MGTKIYVGNLSYDTTDDSLRTAFETGGRTVTDASVIINRDTSRSRGFGFVEMEKDEEAKAAIEELIGSDIDGRTVKVNEARPREDRG